ncbi:hypothetical protein ACFL58_01620 [Elusimicrobiota bacterium]
MLHSLQVGFNFGITSGIITTLGLMIGLNSIAESKMVVIGGILTIAIADAFSDALGIHISEESENVHTTKQIWASTISTFVCKFVTALTFIIPVLVFDLAVAVRIGIIWGVLILSFLSYTMARRQKINPWSIIAEHLVITLIVIVAAHYVGTWISTSFK